MTRRFANQLHNGDEVTIKQTGEVCKVLQVSKDTDLGLGRTATMIAVQTKRDGYQEYQHTLLK